MSKYNAVRVTLDGITFDSKAEARRYSELRLLQQAGQIASLKVHPKYELLEADAGQRAVTYIGDFQYVEGGRVICEDVKGVETAVFRLKANLFRRSHPHVELRVVKA